jgi:hypothetical protein
MPSVLKSYKKLMNVKLPFTKWEANAYPLILKGGKKFGIDPVDYSKPVRIAKSGVEYEKIFRAHQNDFDDIQFNASPEKKDLEITNLCKSLLQPEQVLNIDSQPMISCTLPDSDETVQVPVWFNSSKKGINLRLGYQSGDSSKPYYMRLGSGSNNHVLMGGTTGSGKSVTLHTGIGDILLEYAPWEVNLYLADFKVVELIKYSNRIMTPHVRAVAATKSTEFVLSMFDTLIKEMDAREYVFAAAGAENLDTFRSKYDLVMPQIIVFADEFVQLWENIKISGEFGNDHADEDKSQINAKISALSRLGRSFGLHLFFDSQNMDGALDPQTESQFASGISLKATNSISKMLIGNELGSSIKGYGKCYINSDRTQGNIEDTVLCRVPYIETLLSAEDAAAGKLTQLQELLVGVSNLSDKYGFKHNLLSYTDGSRIPISRFDSDCEYSKDYSKNPQIGGELENKAYKNILFAELPLGHELKFTTNDLAMIPLLYKPGCNLLVAADDSNYRQYILKLLIKAVSLYPCMNTVVEADKLLCQLIQIDTALPSCKSISQAKIPDSILATGHLRHNCIALQELFDDSSDGQWDGDLAYDYCFSENPVRTYSIEGIDMHAIRESVEVNAGITTQMIAEQKISSQTLMDIAPLFTDYSNVYQSFHNELQGQHVTASTFTPKVLWIIGLDLINFSDISYANQIRDLMLNLPTCGIFVIATAKKWDKLDRFVPAFANIVEHCDRAFFQTMALKKYININDGTFQWHDYDKNERHIVKMYAT